MASTFQIGSDSYSLYDYRFNCMKIGFGAYSFSTKKKPKSRTVVSNLKLLYRLHLHLLILTKRLYENCYQLCYFICIIHNAQRNCILVISITSRFYHNWICTKNHANGILESKRTEHTTDILSNGIDTKPKLRLGNYKRKSEKPTYFSRTRCFFPTLKWPNCSNICKRVRSCFELKQYRVTLKYWKRFCFNVVQVVERDQTIRNIKDTDTNYLKRDVRKGCTDLSYLGNAIHHLVLVVGLFAIFLKFVKRLRGDKINSSLAWEVSLKHGMDRQYPRKSDDGHQYSRDSDESKESSASTMTSNTNPVARHSSVSPPHANREHTSSENLANSDKQQQLHRFAYSSLTRSSSQSSSAVKTRISSVDRCRSQSPRKTQTKLLDDPSGNSIFMEYPACVTTPVSTGIYAYYSSNRINNRINSPKERERFSHDKENESPQLIEAISSPKMKISEHALAEQNSPLFSDSTKVRFSFSPRQMYSDDAIIGSTLQTSHSFTDQFGSPLLSTAVYKHGNYFKFPEVDTFTPDPISNDLTSSSSTSMSTKTTATTGTGIEVVSQPVCQKLTTPKSQTSRRVRLKSISLDSEGARLVEDNLGKPVEELIEYTSKVSSSNDSGTIVNQIETEVNPGLQHKEDKGISASNVKVPVEVNNTIQIVVPSSISTVSKSGRKNKNNLKITIDNSNSSSSQHGGKDQVPLVKVQTPKTPTLTQTKQKAFSLDSSDTNNFTCSCPTSMRKYNPQQRSTSNSSKSVNHPSSISVPTTPKRHAYANKKKTYGKSTTNTKQSVSTKSSLHQPSMTSVLSSLESRAHPCYSTNCDDRTMRIAIDIDDNYGECTEEIDDDQIENFYMGEIEDSVVLAADASKVPHANENESRKWGKSSGEAEVDVTNKSGEYFLLGTNLQTQKYGMLSLSNNNLETLPEVMTLTDFTNAGRDEVAKVPVAKAQHDVSHHQSDETRATAVKSTNSTRNNLLQRRGSNHSLTINLNGSLGNLSKCMSVSNYSLGNYTGSNFNLNSCPQHHLGMFHQVPSNTSSTQSIVAHAYGSSQTNIMFANSTSPIQQQPSFEADVATTEATSNKKNILQRRGSNTSLTLNIKGSNHANLSRFSSHSSLNIASAHPSFGFSPAPGKVKQQQPTPSPQPQCNPYHQQQGFRQHSVSRRGLLERRNSNASLTLNIQNVGLTGSSYNLRASACSLNNITNTSVECFDSNRAQIEHPNPIDMTSELASVDGLQQQRKFLSSENLNTMTSRCNKLNQTHVRNSTKTCFGSVSDLKPNALTEFHTKSNQHDEVQTDTAALRHFQQLNLCSCTGVRNITTKPLSPQSTSEDFKMYLANIQLLQNATNVLNEEHLRKLHFVFTQNYETRQQGSYGGSWKTDAQSITGSTTFDETEHRHWTQKSSYTADGLSRFHFNAFPNDDEKKNLLRSLHEEFWDLPTNHQEKPLVFGSQSKNRYKTILPNEHSRVLLELEPENLQEPYINANYIKGPDYAKNSYIVTQGPLPNTVYDYWLMVQQNIAKFQRKVSHDIRRPEDCQQGFKTEYQIDQQSAAVRNQRTSKCHSQKMVMLTNFFEHNQQKCSNYFPIEIDDVLIITNSNDKFENRRLAKFYEKYFDDGRNNGTDSCYEIEIEISQLPDKSSPIDEIPSASYFLIKNCGLHTKDGYSIRKFNGLYVVARPNQPGQPELNAPHKQTLRRFTCYHYWFPDWPDHHSPGNIGFLLDMTLHLLDVCCETEFRPYEVECKCHGYENAQSKNQKNPSVLESLLAMQGDIEPIPIIHCSAGIGRTGCLVAILNGVRQMRSSILLALKPWNFKLTRQSTSVMRNNKNNVNVDVLGIVCNLRLQRGGMVQNSEQYELIHRVLCLYQTRIDAELFQLDTTWNDETLPQRHDDLGDESSII